MGTTTTFFKADATTSNLSLFKFNVTAAIKNHIATCFRQWRVKTVLNEQQIIYSRQSSSIRSANSNFSDWPNENLRNFSLKLRQIFAIPSQKLKIKCNETQLSDKVEIITKFLLPTLNAATVIAPTATTTITASNFSSTNDANESSCSWYTALANMTILDNCFTRIRDEFPDLDKEVRGILMARARDGATIENIKEDYRRITGSPFPVLENVTEFLLTIPSVSAICTSYGTRIFNVVPKANTKHLYELVRNQKPEAPPRTYRRNNSSAYNWLRQYPPYSNYTNTTRSSIGSYGEGHESWSSRRQDTCENIIGHDNDAQPTAQQQQRIDVNKNHIHMPNSDEVEVLWSTDNELTINNSTSSNKNKKNITHKQKEDEEDEPDWDDDVEETNITKSNNGLLINRPPPPYSNAENNISRSESESNRYYQDNCNHLNSFYNQEIALPPLMDPGMSWSGKELNNNNSYINYNNNNHDWFYNSNNNWHNNIDWQNNLNPYVMCSILNQMGWPQKPRPRTQSNNRGYYRQSNQYNHKRKPLNSGRNTPSHHIHMGGSRFDDESLVARNSQYEARILDFLLLGDDFFLFMARMELKCKFNKIDGVLQAGLCVSGQTIRAAIKRVNQMEDSEKSLIVNIGSVDIMQGRPLVHIEHDFRELLNVIHAKGMKPILTTLAPLALCVHDKGIKEKVERFNEFIKRTGRFLKVIDIWECLVNESHHTRFDCFQNAPRQVTGSKESYLYWNKIGRQRVLQLINSQLEY